MNELRFRGGYLKADRRGVALFLATLAFQIVAGVVRVGLVGTLWMIGAMAVLFAVLLTLYRRSWTAVGEDGIRIYRGLGGSAATRGGRSAG
ncbi:hypothetical protein [Kitasatospora cathayae]|uniref:DUF418 domain-containing protein n=1 Tax=Kitasatospora cathayae TaxID=3004092 RepID=A0ABY7PXU2_9ACTN|nr:hypothetical protein [Kitasatospora sp. HUAS 3-15]WBP85184.1 hypothetical protein O1G21_04470 [Kitasatospora sp. HUAS 3-15]